MIKRIIIHKTLIDSFKRKALRAIPKEHIVAILGKLSTDHESLYAYAFDEIEITSQTDTAKHVYLEYYQPEEEIEAGTTLKYYGTLHSHPRGSTAPSEQDKEDFRAHFNNENENFRQYVLEYLPDEIMGIMRVIKKNRVTQYALTFYNIDMTPLELYISESRKK